MLSIVRMLMHGIRTYHDRRVCGVLHSCSKTKVHAQCRCRFDYDVSAHKHIQSVLRSAVSSASTTTTTKGEAFRLLADSEHTKTRNFR